MAMVSSEKLATELGTTHKQVKSLILKHNVRSVPSGSSTMDPGSPQRLVLVDYDAFHDGLAEDAKTNRRPKKAKGSKKKEA
jgi:hypothetical protein|tara:strand:+ start:1589 stop:1831 length:243 start_codon:yes stop_codon:yes gene_type:complete